MKFDVFQMIQTPVSPVFLFFHSYTDIIASVGIAAGEAVISGLSLEVEREARDIARVKFSNLKKS